MRLYDTRIGRFRSYDPLAAKFPWNSPYSYAENDVIRCVDLDGLEKEIYLINIMPDRISTAHIVLPKSGPLGDGIAVQLYHKGSVHSFYGTEASSATEFAKRYEGNGAPGHPYEAYKDQYGYATIGFGHLMTDLDKKRYPVFASNHPYVKGSVISKPDADALFDNDYANKLSLAKSSLKVNVKTSQLRAFTDFSFNIKNAKQRIGSYTQDQGSDFFMQYLRGGPGLEKRRIGEKLMFEGKIINFEFYKSGSHQAKQINKEIQEQPFSGGGDESPNFHHQTVT